MAEIRPIQPPTKTLEDRLEDFERRGVLVRTDARREPLKPVARRDGALKRFLAERDG